jgi:hypothetical protein
MAAEAGSPHPLKIPGRDLNLVVGATQESERAAVTARVAGGLTDLLLPVSMKLVSKKEALENLAKAINLALQSDFLETPLDAVYQAARVRKGRVQMLHRDYIGLGDGWTAKVGKTLKSIRLTWKGPDPASPEGKAARLQGAPNRPVAGLLNLLGRKFNVLQEFEDKVPMYVEQMFDRLEATRVVTGWSRSEWEITTETIGLDVFIAPADEAPEALAPAKA